ncbi:Similar to S.cerevisiae protein COA6 (Protein involved in cytochrome c oxidase (Complex IV) assembly) [Malassezia sympodialis ATCC 42132]|uniref:Similar to S.cerevisiae protein COA6 (Protein involved in cytochrome c oxidase (Complex IV) assembly) n=1 Tax=Malassezia sympodialis (strain ATCC 42132) TaxID=1230383 RepID=A0A1M8A5U6_MALS4|nr:Similar to S.cerevisiae protein COA6 (Protein involved in cytochrome c oxidase (Complex IV) assembly) [Malassezia sympodialis ATCC 42132]
MSKSAATRSNRQRCWDNRDSYYACLTKHNIHSPPGTDMTGIKGPLGAGSFAEPRRSEAERAQLAAMERSNDPCLRERDAYEGSCAQSWIEYFNKRRVLEERQNKYFADAEARAMRR